MATGQQEQRLGVAADGFLSIDEAARFLRVSRARLYQFMNDGSIPFAKFGRCRRVPRAALVRFAESCIATSAN